MPNSSQIVSYFEARIAEYTNSPYAIAVDSCTSALFLCCKYNNVQEVTIPKRTFVSVPSAIIHSGGKVKFSDDLWEGEYQLQPYPIWDSALRLRRNMYRTGHFQCLSFSYKKHLPIGRGGMILTDNEDAAKWFQLARNCGRLLPGDAPKIVGWRCFMTPEEAARGLTLLDFYNEDGYDLTNEYPDLSEYAIYAS